MENYQNITDYENKFFENKELVCYLQLKEFKKQLYIQQKKEQILVNRFFNKNGIIRQYFLDETLKQYFALVQYIPSNLFLKVIVQINSVKDQFYLNNYVSDIAYIDFDTQIIGFVSGKILLTELYDLYKYSATLIPEEIIKGILIQIVKILILFYEQGYYILNISFSNFALYESDKIKDRFFIKLIDSSSIVTNIYERINEDDIELCKIQTDSDYLYLKIQNLIMRIMTFNLIQIKYKFDKDDQTLEYFKNYQKNEFFNLQDYLIYLERYYNYSNGLCRLFEYFLQDITKCKIQKQDIINVFDHYLKEWNASEQDILISISQQQQNFIYQKFNEQLQNLENLSIRGGIILIDDFSIKNNFDQMQIKDFFEETRQNVKDLQINLDCLQDYKQLFNTELDIYYTSKFTKNIYLIIQWNQQKIVQKDIIYKLVQGLVFIHDHRKNLTNINFGSELNNQLYKILLQYGFYDIFYELRIYQEKCFISENYDEIYNQYLLTFISKHINEEQNMHDSVEKLFNLDYMFQKNIKTEDMKQIYQKLCLRYEQNLMKIQDYQIDYNKKIDEDLNIFQFLLNIYDIKNKSKQNQQNFQKTNQSNKQQMGFKDLLQFQKEDPSYSFCLQYLNFLVYRFIYDINQMPKFFKPYKLQENQQQLIFNMYYIELQQMCIEKIINGEKVEQEIKILQKMQPYLLQNEEKENCFIKTPLKRFLQIAKNLAVRYLEQIDTNLSLEETKISSYDFNQLQEDLSFENARLILEQTSNQQEYQLIQIKQNDYITLKLNEIEQTNHDCQKNQKINDQIQNEQIIQQISLKDNNLMDLGFIGKGGFGKVYLYYDIKNDIQYAIKQFDSEDIKEYIKEKEAYIFLNSIFKSNIQQFICNCCGFDDQNLKLAYEFGQHNLKKSYEIISENKNEFPIDLLIHLMKVLVRFNIILNVNSFYHGDIKPVNILFFDDIKQNKEEKRFGKKQNEFYAIYFKIVDFGSLSQEPIKYNKYATKKYKYLKYNKNNIDWDKILFAEMYSSCRTIQELLSKQQKEYLKNILSGNQEQRDSLEINLLNLFDFLSIFLNNKCNNYEKNGIKSDKLIQLAEQTIGTIEETNSYFLFQDKQLITNKIDQMNIFQQLQSVEFQQNYKFKAIYYKQNINNLLNITKNDSIDNPHLLFEKYLQNIEILTFYECLEKEQFESLSQQFKSIQELSDQNILYYISFAFFLFLFGQFDTYQTIVENIKSSNLESWPIQDNLILNFLCRFIQNDFGKDPIIIDYSVENNQIDCPFILEFYFTFIFFSARDYTLLKNEQFI